MESFQGVTERFHVHLASDEGSSQPVVCQVSLDGLFILSRDGQRTLRKFPLNHISRWALRGASLVLYTRTPVDVEERTVTLQGDDRVIRSVLDTLTCCCMQMVELLQTSNGTTENDRAVAESLSAMLNGGGSRKRAALTADQVEFWRSPEKAGWMYSQGEVIKTWRRRWFILKQGFLFRFSDQHVESSSKPRGIVDLTTVQDVSDGRDATGKSNSIRLSTATGSQVCYLCDSETEQVEWLSALEGTLMRIVRAAAGVEEEAAVAAKPARDEHKHNSEWARKLEAGFSTASRGARRTADSNGNPMVKVVGFDSGGQDDYGGAQHADYGNNGAYATIAGYGSVAGARPAPSREPLVSVSYGGYPTGAQRSNDSEASAYGGSHSSMAQQQYDAAPVQPGYSRPAPDLGSDGGYGQQPPNYMDYAPQQSYAASSYQTLPYTSGAAPPQPPQQTPLPSDWLMHHAPDGRPYWHNNRTGITQWDSPAA